MRCAIIETDRHKDCTTMSEITVPLTDKEAARLKLLAAAKGLSEERLLILALRLYDCVDSGDAELIFNGVEDE